MGTFTRKSNLSIFIWIFALITFIYAGYTTTMYMISVDGGYTEWTEFSRCSAECAGGTKTRTRYCSKPVPKYNGRNCSRFGKGIETTECNSQPCPVNGGFGEWGEYGDCSATCGGGTQKRERKCDKPAPQHGGKDCSGDSTETKACNEQGCPVDGKYGDWSDFGACSVECGGGNQTRERKCDNPAPKDGGKECSGESTESKKCNEQLCPVHGGYSDWGEWSTCSVTCGSGTMKRTRICNKPVAELGGKSCIDQKLGDAEESKECKLAAC